MTSLHYIMDILKLCSFGVQKCSPVASPYGRSEWRASRPVKAERWNVRSGDVGEHSGLRCVLNKVAVGLCVWRREHVERDWPISPGEGRTP